jgi:hypothetical protein
LHLKFIEFYALPKNHNFNKFVAERFVYNNFIIKKKFREKFLRYFLKTNVKTSKLIMPISVTLKKLQYFSPKIEVLSIA